MIQGIDIIRRDGSNNWLEQIAKLHTTFRGKLQWKDAFPFYLWNIWIARNDSLYKDKDRPILTSLPYTRAMEYVALAGRCETKRRKQIEYFKWEPPNHGFKLNTDGAYTNGSHMGGIGGIIRNTEGEWLIGYMGNILANDNIEAELIPLVQGLKLAHQHHLTPLEINTDCHIILDILKLTNHTKYWNVILIAGIFYTPWGTPPITHVYREANNVADALAKEGAKLYSLDQITTWTVPPFFVREHLDADKHGTLFGRLTFKQAPDNRQGPVVQNICNSVLTPPHPP